MHMKYLKMHIDDTRFVIGLGIIFYISLTDVLKDTRKVVYFDNEIYDVNFFLHKFHS